MAALWFLGTQSNSDFRDILALDKSEWKTCSKSIILIDVGFGRPIGI